jgi:hypothetical protein
MTKATFSLLLALTMCSFVVAQTLRADIDRDGDVDFDDFLVLASDFGQKGSPVLTTIDTVYIEVTAERLPIREWNDLHGSLAPTVY